MTLRKPKVLSLHDDAIAVLDAVVARHNLRGHSEAVRHICAALASAYGCDPVEVIRNSGRPTQKLQIDRRRAVLPNELIQSLPAAPRDAWGAWLAEGVRPDADSVNAAVALWGAELVTKALAHCGGAA
jgi:hypothetical protein